jgi:hypothetical protein
MDSAGLPYSMSNAAGPASVARVCGGCKPLAGAVTAVLCYDCVIGGFFKLLAIPYPQNLVDLIKSMPEDEFWQLMSEHSAAQRDRSRNSSQSSSPFGPLDGRGFPMNLQAPSGAAHPAPACLSGDIQASAGAFRNAMYQTTQQPRYQQRPLDVYNPQAPTGLFFPSQQPQPFASNSQFLPAGSPNVDDLFQEFSASNSSSYK